MELSLKQFVPSQTCLACDVCCRFVDENSIWAPVLTDVEKAGLPQNLVSPENKLKLKPLKDVLCPQDDKYLTGFACTFFEPKKNSCKIYLKRPWECQLYPFLLVKNNKKVSLGLDIKCPFAKERQNSYEFKEFIRYLVIFFKKNDIKNIIKNNPQIIGNYKDDVVFLEELDFL